MSCEKLCTTFLALMFLVGPSTAFYRRFECGPYGFACEGKNRVRLCEGDTLRGPTFICPEGTICNDDYQNVCENTINYIDSSVIKSINCRRNERLADPTVPGCKGYILCIPNKNHFQGIKFKCAGNTIFNGYTRTCASPEKYKCPLPNVTKVEYFEGNRRISHHEEKTQIVPSTGLKSRPVIDCKNYKFRVTQDHAPVRATYFCPTRPVRNGEPTKCTVFSNQYCITLERDDEDQFMQYSNVAYRKPRGKEFYP